MNERHRRETREREQNNEVFHKVWHMYEPYLPGNILRPKTAMFSGGTLTNLTPEQFEKCLQALSGQR